MLSDHSISIAGRVFSISNHDLIVAGMGVIIGLLFWAVLHFHRKRIVVLQRSVGVDQIVLELARIADALERIANQPAPRMTEPAVRREKGGDPPHVSFSMLGR